MINKYKNVINKSFLFGSLPITLLTMVIALYLFLNNYPAAFAADASSLDPRIHDLYKHLSQTKAIGIFTKLSIKNNASRLNKSFAVYHKGERPPSLEELRERYNLMVQEMVMVVQSKDPELAREINATRSLLWSYMSDPEKHKFI